MWKMSKSNKQISNLQKQIQINKINDRKVRKNNNLMIIKRMSRNKTKMKSLRMLERTRKPPEIQLVLTKIRKLKENIRMPSRFLRTLLIKMIIVSESTIPKNQKNKNLKNGGLLPWLLQNRRENRRHPTVELNFQEINQLSMKMNNFKIYYYEIII